MSRLTAGILVAGVLCGCAAHAPIGGTEMIRTELYFGMTRPNGADVTDAEFEAFLDEVVGSHFPSGHTVLTAQGRWREGSGRSRKEPSRVLIILHPPDAASNRRIEQIREAYKARFDQEAVLRVDDRERVWF